MNSRPIDATVRLGLFLTVALTGLQLSADDTVPARPLASQVGRHVERQDADHVDFLGTTAVAQSVKIIPRVTGYMIGASFKEGAEVKRGDPLFEIDPRPYQLQLDQAQRQLDLERARLTEAHADSARAKDLAKTPGAISESDLARYQAAEAEAAAAVEAAKAGVAIHKLNLMFCHVTSPIDGRAGRYLLTPGNLVKQDNTVLTTIRSSDPMYVYFSVDERTLLRIRRAINDGQMKSPEREAYPVSIGLQDESNYPHAATINFFDGQVDPATGTITCRGVVQNPKREGGTRLMLPGMSVRVHMPLVKSHAAPSKN